MLIMLILHDFLSGFVTLMNFEKYLFYLEIDFFTPGVIYILNLCMQKVQ